jgi:phosphoglycerol transferase MdoB-like AlkP superfamily enzyme
MKTKFFVVPILVIALFTVISAPPAHAELVTLTVILAVAFASAVVAKNVVNSNQDKETASKPDAPDSNKQASTDYMKLEPAPQ